MSNSIKKPQTPFTQTPNSLLNDQSISLSAKGLFSFMLSKPDGWNFTLRGLSSQLKEGLAATSSAMNELKESGWITYRKFADGRGEYELHFSPQNPNLENRDLADPNLEKPDMGFRNDLDNKEISKKEKRANAKSQHFSKPTLEAVTAFFAEKGYESEAEKFYDYYESVGWVVGKARTPMKNWKAAVRNWLRNREAHQPKASFSKPATAQIDFNDMSWL